MEPGRTKVSNKWYGWRSRSRSRRGGED